MIAIQSRGKNILGSGLRELAKQRPGWEKAHENWGKPNVAAEWWANGGGEGSVSGWTPGVPSGRRSRFRELCLWLGPSPQVEKACICILLKSLPGPPGWASGNCIDIQALGGKTHALFTSRFLSCPPNSIQKQLNFHWAVNIIHRVPLLF